MTYSIIILLVEEFTDRSIDQETFYFFEEGYRNYLSKAEIERGG